MTTSNKMIIVGVSGRDRSGKDTVADLLIAAGYFGASGGDIIRGYARERHKGEPDPVSVKNMTETSNWLRQTKGADAVLKEQLEQFEQAKKQGKDYKGIVIWSVRAPIEVDFVLKHGGELVWVEATDEVRYQRKIANLREGEAKVTLEEMLAQEALQADPQPGIPEEVQMNLNYVKSKATITIENNGNDLKAFEDEIKKALKLGK